MTQKSKSSLKRFGRGLLAAFVTGAVAIQFQEFQNINDYLWTLLASGGVGMLLYLDKWLRWKDNV